MWKKIFKGGKGNHEGLEVLNKESENRKSKPPRSDDYFTGQVLFSVFKILKNCNIKRGK